MSNAPRVSDPVAGTLGVAIAASVLLAWWCGRRSGRAHAYASAVAHAEARAAAAARAESAATAQAAVVVNVGDGLRAQAGRHLGGLDDAPWIGEPVPLIEQEASEMAAEDVYGAVDDSEAIVREEAG
ncbi:MAG TPA: hypothetical protein VGC67_01895 [Cellulomonas sp.]